MLPALQIPRGPYKSNREGYDKGSNTRTMTMMITIMAALRVVVAKIIRRKRKRT